MRLLDSTKKRNTLCSTSTTVHRQQEAKRFVAFGKGASSPPDLHVRPKMSVIIHSVHSELLYTAGRSLHPQPEEVPRRIKGGRMEFYMCHVPCFDQIYIYI